MKAVWKGWVILNWVGLPVLGAGGLPMLFYTRAAARSFMNNPFIELPNGPHRVARATLAIEEKR